MKRACLLLFFVILAAAAYAQVPEFRPQFSIMANDDLTVDDFYELQGSLRLKFPISEDIELIFKTELDKYEVDVEELSAVFSIDRVNSLKAGKFENPLTLDDYLGRFDRPFARNTVVTREIKKQGYVTRSVGLKYEHKDSKNDDFNWFGHFVYVPSQLEPQINFGYLFREKDEKLLAGILASYFPFINHDAWDGSEAYTNLHNFLINLLFTDYRNPYIYGAELTLGSNLVSPVGLINHSPETEYPMFAGVDIHAGVRYYLSQKISWTPLVRLTSLHPEISEFECRDMDLVLGNRFGYGENLKLNIDGGLGFVTRYDTYGDNELKTKTEIRWAVSLVVKGN